MSDELKENHTHDEVATGGNGQNNVTIKNKSSFGFKNKFARVLWGVVYLVLFRPSPRVCHNWRRWLLVLFGAQIGENSTVYPTAKIWLPENLQMGRSSSIGPNVDCYCVDKVVIGDNCIVSQYSYLCTASHDISSADFKLITAPIHICDQAWVAADVFIAPGVTVNEGSVVGARSSVYKDVPSWTVVGGNPARFIKERKLSIE